jgi:hypothetical protein
VHVVRNGKPKAMISVEARRHALDGTLKMQLGLRICPGFIWLRTIKSEELFSTP